MPTPSASNFLLNKLTGANNDLGFKLLAWLVGQEAGKNVLISPLSVAIALAMTYNGAEGKTKEALAKLLGLTGFSLQQINEGNARLLSLLVGIDPDVQCTIANSIWVRQGNPPLPSFIQQIKDNYEGEVASLDFEHPEAADMINRWVGDKTQDKIRQLVTPALVKQAILVLINAIYFKGIWASPFDKEKTLEREFHKSDGTSKLCPMMAQSGNYDYYETDEFQAVSIPYGAGRISMYLFLPKLTYSIGDFQKALGSINWQMWMGSFESTKGDILLPRFKIEYEHDLLEGLVTLGGNEIADVDFMAIGAGPLLISQVIHKTIVEVNEEGTEAAAATAVIVLRMMPSQSFRMIVDRPFFTAIRDNLSGAVLFTGLVLDPTET